MTRERIAVTAEIDNGLDSPISGHFGHCRAFIVSTVEDGEIVSVETLHNGGHTTCAQPVNLLTDNDVDVLITLGMGGRPFMVAQQTGLRVIRGTEGTVRNAVQQYIDGKAQVMSAEGLCQGGRAHR